MRKFRAISIISTIVLLLTPRLPAYSGSDVPNTINHGPNVTSNSEAVYEIREIEGWQVHVSRKLLETQTVATAKSLELLEAQLKGIVAVVPTAAVARLREVALWVSPEYPGFSPRAEYHPDAGWLRANKRNPAMAKGVEFTNVRIFESEVKRMPVFVLHELAHAYHDRFLGFDHPEIKTAYLHALEGKKYDAVKRYFADGTSRVERAYAMTDEHEYFAEGTEAYFGRNDFFPFTRDELETHDPELFKLMGRVWNTGAVRNKE